MSEEKKPSVVEMQMEINRLLGERVDLLVTWNKSLTDIVKSLTERVVALESGECACKKGEM
jgi:hypothetical protein